MNLKFKNKDMELELTNSTPEVIQKTLLALMESMDNLKFKESFGEIIVKEKKKRMFSNHVSTVEGKKELNGVTLYQCAYHCSCGNQGKRFVKEDASVTTCHKCSATMPLQPAATNEAHDEEYNYFIAY